MPKAYPSMTARLLANSIRVGDCLLWNGPCNENGYGRVSCRVKGRKHPIGLYVHRVAWEIVHGPIPEGMTVDHLKEEGICFHKNCWNEAHMRLLTLPENVSKMRRFKLQKVDREWMRQHGVQSSLT